MKRHLVVLATLLLFAGGVALAQSTPKIAVFDAGRISEETAEGKRIQGQLTALQDKKRAELAEKEKKINDLQQQLQQQGLSLSAEKRAQMEKDGQKLVLDLNQAREAARNELQVEVQDAQNRFQTQLLQVVEQFGRDEGFDLILEKSLVAYSSTAVDVTTALVDRFNQLVPAEKSAAPAAPAGNPPKK